MKNLPLFISFVILLSCAPSLKFTVKNIQDRTTIDENSFIYTLPRTRLLITVTAVCHQIIPGPYQPYAEKFLGIKNTPSLPETEWELYHVKLEAFDEPDPDYFFSVESKQPEQVIRSLLQMKKLGFVLKLDEINPFVNFSPDFNEKSGPCQFTDLTAKRNDKRTSEKKKEKQNKGMVSMNFPGSKQNAGEKTLEQKAEEAANFIIKIRKRRFKLLSGQYAIYPQGEALETSVKELDDLETNYLSLFIGETYTDTLQRAFYYIPGTSTEIERNVLCRFSDKTGFEDPISTSGKPLVLELKDMQLTGSLDRLQFTDTGADNNNILYYRVPDKASVRIFYGSIPVIESELKVFQYGTMMPYSIKSKVKE